MGRPEKIPCIRVKWRVPPRGKLTRSALSPGYRGGNEDGWRVPPAGAVRQARAGTGSDVPVRRCCACLPTLPSSAYWHITALKQGQQKQDGGGLAATIIGIKIISNALISSEFHLSIFSNFCFWLMLPPLLNVCAAPVLASCLFCSNGSSTLEAVGAGTVEHKT